jgi:hypothetical protein
MTLKITLYTYMISIYQTDLFVLCLPSINLRSFQSILWSTERGRPSVAANPEGLRDCVAAEGPGRQAAGRNCPRADPAGDPGGGGGFGGRGNAAG